MSFSAGGDAHPEAAPATPMPTSFRKSRRLNVTESDTPWLLVVADHAIHAGRMLGVIEVLPVTAHAPTHLQRGILVNDRHLLHRPMAGLAGDSGFHVSLVVELHVVGQPIDLDPRHLLTLVVVASELLDLGLVHRRDLVATHAGPDRRDVRDRRLLRAGMTVETGHLQLTRVDLVTEVDGLRRSVLLSELDRERLCERHAGCGARHGDDDEGEGTFHGVGPRGT